MSNVDFSDFCTDEVLEVEGVWRNFGSGTKVKLARWENKEHRRLLRTLAMKEQEVLDGKDDLAEETGDLIMQKVMAKTILKDWEGLTENGQLIPFNSENAFRLLGNRDFRAKIKSMSNVIDNYKVKAEEVVLKP